MVTNTTDRWDTKIPNIARFSGGPFTFSGVEPFFATRITQSARISMASWF
jgi:hypothetical protein